ncbi:MAG: phosphoadenylyl-sulfate reductase [Boseongicola sp.]|nr:MAG: phosphoadenylyl-sulfate reductase [Boseongicola sp.]
MPLESPPDLIADRVADLNRRYTHHSAIDVLEHAMFDPSVGPTALVSSFGAESVVLLHMVSIIDRTVPVIFLDTEMLFPETLDYQREVAARLGLTDVRVTSPDRTEAFLKDPNNRLHTTNTDACCALRKTEPLNRALEDFDAWVTGRKRFQGGKRAELSLFEEEDEKRIKINPLAKWMPEDIRDYMQNNRLPSHPLVAKGFPSIGCAPCTTRVGEGEDQRAGRWRGQVKQECGIHFDGEKIVRRSEEKDQ